MRWQRVSCRRLNAGQRLDGCRRWRLLQVVRRLSVWRANSACWSRWRLEWKRSLGIGLFVLTTDASGAETCGDRKDRSECQTQNSWNNWNEQEEKFYCFRSGGFVAFDDDVRCANEECHEDLRCSPKAGKRMNGSRRNNQMSSFMARSLLSQQAGGASKTSAASQTPQSPVLSLIFQPLG